MSAQAYPINKIAKGRATKVPSLENYGLPVGKVVRLCEFTKPILSIKYRRNEYDGGSAYIPCNMFYGNLESCSVHVCDPKFINVVGNHFRRRHNFTLCFMLRWFMKRFVSVMILEQREQHLSEEEMCRLSSVSFR